MLADLAIDDNGFLVAVAGVIAAAMAFVKPAGKSGWAWFRTFVVGVARSTGEANDAAADEWDANKAITETARNDLQRYASKVYSEAVEGGEFVVAKLSDGKARELLEAILSGQSAWDAREVLKLSGKTPEDSPRAK